MNLLKNQGCHIMNLPMKKTQDQGCQMLRSVKSLPFKDQGCQTNGRLLCYDRSTVCEEMRCDGNPDCPTGEDEANCQFSE